MKLALWSLVQVAVVSVVDAVAIVVVAQVVDLVEAVVAIAEETVVEIVGKPKKIKLLRPSHEGFFFIKTALWN
jgi:hypothetical protein